MVFFQTRKDLPPRNPICHSYWRATATIVQMLHWGCFRYVGLVRRITYLFLKQLQEARDFRGADVFFGALSGNEDLRSERMLRKRNAFSPPDAINVRCSAFQLSAVSFFAKHLKHHTNLRSTTLEEAALSSEAALLARSGPSQATTAPAVTVLPSKHSNPHEQAACGAFNAQVRKGHS
jgi:hypothetical protein